MMLAQERIPRLRAHSCLPRDYDLFRRNCDTSGGTFRSSFESLLTLAPTESPFAKLQLPEVVQIYRIIFARPYVIEVALSVFRKVFGG